MAMIDNIVRASICSGFIECRGAVLDMLADVHTAGLIDDEAILEIERRVEELGPSCTKRLALPLRDDPKSK